MRSRPELLSEGFLQDMRCLVLQILNQLMIFQNYQHLHLLPPEHQLSCQKIPLNHFCVKLQIALFSSQTCVMTEIYFGQAFLGYNHQ